MPLSLLFLIDTCTFTQYGEQLEIVSNYKYLGIILDEHLKFDTCARSLADATGRALAAVISKVKMLKNSGYVTFKKMYMMHADVKTVYEYRSGVWGYIKSKDIDMIQNRAMRYFLVVHRFAPTAGIIGDMGWIRPGLSRIRCMTRLWNRFINMEIQGLRNVSLIGILTKMLEGVQNWKVFLMN